MDQAETKKRMPVVFLAHGAPVLLDDARWMGELSAWAKAMPKPTGILIMSAHWEEPVATLGATTRVPLVYDFYGFPQRYYETQYPSPPAGDLANRVRGLLTASGIELADNPKRGLDHGAYVPLVPMYSRADVPVLQLSMATLDLGKLFALGQALSPLRDEGILIIGSGFLVHNMSYAFKSGTPAWAKDFDAWAADAISRFDIDALREFQSRCPAAANALPTYEHYAPLLFAAGAASGTTPVVTFPITGFWMNGAFTRRSVQFS
jgi:4,5-DOPA dioxygenase extradiol